MRNLLLIAFLTFASNLFAQGTWGPDKSFNEVSDFYLELIGGYALSEMQYSDPAFELFDKENLMKPTMGLALRYHLNKMLSLGMSANYQSLGLTLVSDDSYSLKANYISVGLPVTFDCCVRKKKRLLPNLFVYASPYIAYNLNNELGVNDVFSPMSDDDMAKLDYGAEAGLGVRIPTFSMDGKSYLNIKASFFQGLANTLPASIPVYSDQPVASMFLTSNGNRLNQGIRLTITYELSLEKRKMTTFTAGGDGKRTYKKYVNVK